MLTTQGVINPLYQDTNLGCCSGSGSSFLAVEADEGGGTRRQARGSGASRAAVVIPVGWAFGFLKHRLLVYQIIFSLTAR